MLCMLLLSIVSALQMKSRYKLLAKFCLMKSLASPDCERSMHWRETEREDVIKDTLCRIVHQKPSRSLDDRVPRVSILRRFLSRILCKQRCGGRVSFPYGKDIRAGSVTRLPGRLVRRDSDEAVLLGSSSLVGTYALLTPAITFTREQARRRNECESRSCYGQSVILDFLKDPCGFLQRGSMIISSECTSAKRKEERERNKKWFVFRPREVVTASALSSAISQMPGDDTDYPRRCGDLPVALAAALGTASTRHG